MPHPLHRLALALLVIAGCAKSSSPAMGAAGSTIAILQSGELAVVNPDQGSLSFVDAQTLEASATIAIGAAPRALLQLRSGALWVLAQKPGELVIVDPIARSITQRQAICAGPGALAESPDATFVAVACEWSGQALRIDEATLAVTVLAENLHQPHAIAIAGSSLLVAELIGGDLIQIQISDSTQTRLSLVPTQAAYRPALTKMTANLAAAMAPAFGHLFVAHELVNHTGDTSDEPIADDYGTVITGAPKINAAVTRFDLSGEGLTQAAAPTQAATPPIYSRFDLAQHAFSGPSALASFGDRYLLVAHQSTNDVAVLDSEAADPDARLVGSFSVGAGPMGIAVDELNGVAYVDNALDNSISRIDFNHAWSGSAAPILPAQLTQVRGLAAAYSQAALDGRRLFFDATNPHVTPSRVVSCASCHPGGGDDGLVWFIHTATIPLKRRRTPHLINAGSGTVPFHWNGELPTMSALTSSTITGLMGGDGLLVDTTKVQAYVDEIVQAEAPAAPPQDAALVSRGEAIFQSAGCAVCHAGALFTDDAKHVVLAPMSLTTDDQFTSANTPSLHGLFLRASLFHDGRAADLNDLLTRPDAAIHSGESISVDDQAALIAYLKTL